MRLRTHTFLAALLTALNLVLLQALPQSTFAQWTVIHDFGQPMSVVHFIDEDIGFAGTGNFSRTGIARIFKTIDGGQTWKQVNVPRVDFAFVANITMKGSTGYAAINTQDIGISLWKTTDQGENWFDNSPRQAWDAVDALDVGRAVVVSTWQGGGWVQKQPSLVWINESDYEGDEYRTNGIASNGEDAVLTGWSDQEWFSKDGGLTWNRTIGGVPEAWSVYALEGTRSFYTASEGPQNNPTRTIWRSTDGGENWDDIYLFPDTNMSFTGHIDGKNQVLYVQSDINAGLGMFRSDDLGLSWKSVGGPVNLRDTRFEVLGCGDIVYAFDRTGKLHKTSNGGGKVVSVQQDTIFIQGNSCEPTRLPINLVNPMCIDVRIDSVTSLTRSARIDLERTESRLLPGSSNDSIIFTYRDPQDPIDTTVVTVYTSDGSKQKVVIVSRNLLALNFRLGDPESKYVGENVNIPIYVSKIQGGATVSKASFKMRVEQDLLANWSVTNGTVTPFEESVLIELEWNPPLSAATPYDQPVAVLTAKNFLATTRFTDLILDSVGVTANGSVSPCSSFTTNYTQLEDCGDSTIRNMMLRSDIPSIISVGPVPFKNKSWVATKLGLDCELRLVDMLGRDHSTRVRKGANGSFEINAVDLNSGTYIILLTHDGHVVDTRTVLKAY